MNELYTACNCDCSCETVEESPDFNFDTSINDDVDRQAHLRELLDSWVQAVDFRSEDDVQQWIENDGYRPRDALNRLREEKEAGEPLENFDPWPDKTRDPRNNDPYPVSVRRNSVRTYSSDEAFDWDLSVGE